MTAPTATPCLAGAVERGEAAGVWGARSSSTDESSRTSDGAAAHASKQLEEVDSHRIVAKTPQRPRKRTVGSTRRLPGSPEWRLAIPLDQPS
jgi:hypothetical protein